MKRFDFEMNGDEMLVEETPDGQWVHYEEVDRLITGAILHGKIGGLEHGLRALMNLQDMGGDLAGMRDWLERRIRVNRRMLEVLRETGTIPASVTALELEARVRELDAEKAMLVEQHSSSNTCHAAEDFLAEQPAAPAIGERCPRCDQRLDAESERDAYHTALLEKLPDEPAAPASVRGLKL